MISQMGESQVDRAPVQVELELLKFQIMKVGSNQLLLSRKWEERVPIDRQKDNDRNRGTCIDKGFVQKGL